MTYDFQISQVISAIQPRDYHVDFTNNHPVPWLLFENFLPSAVHRKIYNEIDLIPSHHMRSFTRNGSYMEELNSFSNYPFLRGICHEFNSSEFVTWLEQITSQLKLIPDPHLIGAGLMKSYRGDSLKMHTDFNWNEELHLNRKVNVIYYCSSYWEDTWGGHLHLQDKNNSNTTVIPHKPNSLLIWLYDSKLWHGHPEPLNCPQHVSRNGLRFFYYESNGSPVEPPHRSLYYKDDQGNPIDKK